MSKSWGWGFISLGCLLIAFQQWLMGVAALLLGVIMIFIGRGNAKKGEDDGDQEDSEGSK